MNPITSRLLCSLVLTGALFAQVEAPTPAVGTFVLPGDACVEAEGRDWHASLGADGIHFLPALGAAAERPAVLALSLQDHGRGLRRRVAAAVQPETRGGRVVYPRGSVEEFFDVREEGLELGLRFAERPLGDGDLVVRYRVTTALPVAEVSSRGVLWSDPVGGVRIGAVAGIAADGRRVAGNLTLQGDMIEFALPAEFVDTATYPIVLDPLIGTSLALTSGFADTAPAAAFDPVSQKYLLTWVRTFSVQQAVIRGQMLNTAGSPTGALLAIDNSVPVTSVCWHPSVAVRSGEFHVGWSSAIDRFLIPNAYAAKVTALGVVSGQTMLFPQGGFMDLSSTPFTNILRFTTWGSLSTGQTGSLLWTGSGYLTQVLSTSGRGFAALSRGAAPASPFLAYEYFGELRLVDVGGAFPYVSVVQGPQGRLHGTALAMIDSSHGIVVWAQEQSGSSGRSDLWACAFHHGGSPAVLVLDTAPIAIAVDPNRDETAPSVVSLGGKYGIAWQSADSAGHVDVLYRDFAPDCLSCGAVTQLNGSGVLAGAPALVGAETVNGDAVGEGLLFAVQTSGLLPTAGAIVRRPVTRFVGGPIVEAGPACSYAGTFDTIGGPAALGNPDFTYRLQNFPAGGLTFFLLGLPGGETSCGLCTFVNPVVTQYVTPTSAVEVLRPMPLPCRSGFLGLTLAAQWLVFGTTSAPCPAAPSLVASRRLHATLGM